MAQEMLTQFHSANPNINVFFAQDPDNLQEKMISDFQTGSAPDVLAGCCDFFPMWAQQGYLLDLRPFVEADLDRATIDDWNSVQYAALTTRDGARFGLPKYHGALALYYNKDLFDQLGVDYPDGTWDHDDYEDAMHALIQDVDQDGKIGVWGGMVDISWERLQVHVNGWGGHFVDPQDPTHSMMAHPESTSALQWIHDQMWRNHTMASMVDVQSASTRQAFAEQRVATVEEGSWALKDILETAKFRVGVTSLPAGPARKVTLATTDGFGIYAGTRYPEAAWQLLKFLVSPDYGRAMARTHLLQPARSSLLDEWVKIVQDAYPQQTRDMDLAVFGEGQAMGYSVTAEIFPNMTDARKLAQAAWSEIFTLGQKEVGIMHDISAQIEVAQRGRT